MLKIPKIGVWMKSMWASSQTFSLAYFFFKINKYRDPWVAQRFSACLWPRARSWRPGIESHIGLPVHGACFSLCLCLCLSLSLCDYHKKKKNKINKYKRKKKAIWNFDKTVATDACPSNPQSQHTDRHDTYFILISRTEASKSSQTCRQAAGAWGAE